MAPAPADDDNHEHTGMEQTDEPVATVAAAAETSEDFEDYLPSNRFELELEFVQSLASPAYLHFLATYRDDDELAEIASGGGAAGRGSAGGGSAGGSGEGGDSRPILMRPDFKAYLKYLLATWSQPEYSRFLSYPHALYFLQLLVERSDSGSLDKEWSLPAFRNFCHQQQFLAWQHRHSTLYGQGSATSTIDNPSTSEQT